MRARLADIVELRDGGFELLAKRRGAQMRLMWVLRWFIALLAFLGFVAMIDLAVFHPIALHGLSPWVLPAICFCIGLGAWFVLQPPVVRVTADKVSVGAWPLIQRVAPSDLAYIFRGQARDRYGWTPTYFVVTQDETPRIAMLAESFTDQGMTELANRLHVPIKGDFTAHVR